MKSGFTTDLDAKLRDDDRIWVIVSPLKYWSELLNCLLVVPPWFETENAGQWGEDACFETDFASVPRWIPVASNALLDRAHRESVLHDYLYCINSVPVVTRAQADSVLLEAMESRGKPWNIRYPIYWGVRLGGWKYYHKRKVTDKL
jgi:hypothetical protein